MTLQPDVAAKRQVSESVLLLLHAEIVDYNLRGSGGRFYDVPNTDIENENDTDIKNESDNKLKSNLAMAQSAKRRRLEALGQDIGRRLGERHAHYRDRLELDLDKVKFICKDFWESTFRKQIDVLRTNHRGLYVLTDNHFHWLSSIAPSTSTTRTESSATTSIGAVADDFVVLPCGIICGALTKLGLKCRVTADLFPTEPGYRVSFNVQLIQ